MDIDQSLEGSGSTGVAHQAVHSTMRVPRRSLVVSLGLIAFTLILPPAGTAQEVSEAAVPADGSLSQSDPTDVDSQPQARTASYRAGLRVPDVQQWIDLLGHDSYQVRETAAKQLMDAGEGALGELQVAADSFDPEVRARAERVLAQVSEAAFQRRLDEFLADASGAQGVSLPGWEQFSGIVDDSPESRELFVLMQRSEGALLEQMLTGDRFEAIQQFQTRLTQLQSSQRIVIAGLSGNSSPWPGLGTCATALFIECLHEGGTDGQLPQGVTNLAMQPAMRAAVQSSSYREPLRSLLSHWVLVTSRSSPVDVQRKIELTRAFQLRGALPAMVAIARGDEPFSVQPALYRTEALLTAAVLCDEQGGEALIGQVEPLLEDSTVAQRSRAANRPDLAVVEMRDVALAVVVHLSGQNPAAYGFPNVRRNAEHLYEPASLAFPNEESRTNAIEKWRRWRQSEPQTEAG